MNGKKPVVKLQGSIAEKEQLTIKPLFRVLPDFEAALFVAVLGVEEIPGDLVVDFQHGELDLERDLRPSGTLFFDPGEKALAKHGHNTWREIWDRTLFKTHVGGKRRQDTSC